MELTVHWAELQTNHGSQVWQCYKLQQSSYILWQSNLVVSFTRYDSPVWLCYKLWQSCLAVLQTNTGKSGTVKYKLWQLNLAVSQTMAVMSDSVTNKSKHTRG